jgi:hypothetical protein
MRKLGLAALLLGAALSSARAENVGGYDNGIASGSPNWPAIVVTAGAYSSGQSIGGLQTIRAFRTTTVLSWIFDNLQFTSKGGSTTAMTVYTYDTKPIGTCSDTQAFAENAADIPNRFMAPFVLTPAVVGVGSTTTTAQLTQVVPGQNHDSPQTQNLYMCIVIGGTVTPASTTDLIGKISGAQD